ncbi:CHCH domain-containing protein [Carex littledalei]|uniref:CHCH domain-containing protein n=1 Tax=Carex littledalei TaxID=544730 RepID=A0A833VME4_9POAL|nr:CHCH domain-containing protein [Carex littledalei]
MEKVTAHPECAQEALDLLNCLTESSYDRDKCVKLLDAVRSCVLQKKVKKFSLAEMSQTPPVQKN